LSRRRSSTEVIAGLYKNGYDTGVTKALLALALAAAGYVAYTHRDWVRYERLSRGGVMSQGWVTGKSDAKRGLVYYAFETPRKVFTDTGSGGFGNPDAAQLNEGDKVLVYYLPDNPDVSCLGDPSDRVREQNIALVWILLPAAGVAGWALSRELRKHT
jgi:hypothetical protein